jgi:hypothetical protein
MHTDQRNQHQHDHGCTCIDARGPRYRIVNRSSPPETTQMMRQAHPLRATAEQQTASTHNELFIEPECCFIISKIGG